MVLELVWTVSALVGLWAAGRGFRSAITDRRILRVTGTDGVLRILAGERLWRNLASLYIHGVFAAVGVLALATPGNPPFSLVGFLFTFCNIALVSVNVMEQHHRGQINRLRNL